MPLSTVQAIEAGRSGRVRFGPMEKLVGVLGVVPEGIDGFTPLFCPRHRVAGAHGLGLLQGEAARRAPGEDGQAPEQRALRGMAVVSGYPCPLYRELYGDWPVVARRARTNGARAATEALWLSPRAAAQLGTRQLALLEQARP